MYEAICITGLFIDVYTILCIMKYYQITKYTHMKTWK